VQSKFDRDPAGAGQEMIPSLVSSACAVAALLFAGMAAAAGSTPSGAQARYQQDRAACISGRSNEDRATCLREAGAALQAAKQGRLGDGSGAYEKNRLARCEPLPPADREDCVRRVNGEGTVSGSVEEGGTFTELRTTVPAH